jgi:hypothetical protein
VCAVIAPFNFPGMIPFWFLPYAIACGNTVVIKPSERVPLTMQKVFALVNEIGLPPGVLNLVNGGRDVVNGLLDHPAVRSVSFVGSSAVARYVYAARPPPASARSARAARRIRWSSSPDADLGRPPMSLPTAHLAAPASAASPRHSPLRWAPRTSRSRRDSRPAQSRVVGIRPRRGRADGAR